MVGFVGCGIGIAAFLGATEVGYFSLISLFLPLYVRLKKKDVLSHFTRGQIFGYIQANPGTHYNAIIQDLRLHNGVGAYHLSVLEREGFIRSLRDGIYKRFYPSTMRIPEKRLHLSRIQRDIFEVINNVKSEAISADHIEYVKNMVLATYLRSDETINSAVFFMTSSQVLTGDPHFYEKYVKKIKKVSPKDIKDVCNKYRVSRTTIIRLRVIPDEFLMVANKW